MGVKYSNFFNFRASAGDTFRDWALSFFASVSLFSPSSFARLLVYFWLWRKLLCVFRCQTNCHYQSTPSRTSYCLLNSRKGLPQSALYQMIFSRKAQQSFQEDCAPWMLWTRQLDTWVIMQVSLRNLLSSLCCRTLPLQVNVRMIVGPFDSSVKKRLTWHQGAFRSFLPTLTLGRWVRCSLAFCVQHWMLLKFHFEWKISILRRFAW